MSSAHFQNWVLGLFLRNLYIKENNLWFELQIFLFYCLLGFALFLAESVFFSIVMCLKALFYSFLVLFLFLIFYYFLLLFYLFF